MSNEGIRAKVAVLPQEIKKRGDQAMKITWSDGHVSEYSAAHLRENCRCAACVNELTGERLIAPGSVPKDLKLAKAEVVGNYALGFQFGDGHATGIYTFQTLRSICPCPSCGKEEQSSS